MKEYNSMKKMNRNRATHNLVMNFIILVTTYMFLSCQKVLIS